MPIAKLGRVRICYEAHGSGETVVLIAGYASSKDIWFRQIPELSRHYRVITFDNRGSGRSAKPDEPYTMNQYAQDTAYLLDRLGVDGSHVCGVSLGGMIAQEFALQFPDRVRTLTLACTSAGGSRCILPDHETMDLLLNRDRRNGMTREEWTRWTLPYSFTQEFIDGNPDIIDRYVQMRVRHWPPPHSFRRQAEALIAHDVYDRLPRIKAPTLVISGNADRQVPVENSKIIASDIPDAHLVILDGMGHGPRLPVPALPGINPNPCRPRREAAVGQVRVSLT
jgi:pimeloyl-ACP methyl ester carboxylesterase